MTNYERLPMALRCCAGANTKPTKCPDYGDSWCDGKCLDKHLTAAADAIEELQAQLPKRGKWVGIEYDGYADGNPVYDVWECSECGEEHEGEEDTLTNYCPNCGAKMEVQDDKA